MQEWLSEPSLRVFVPRFRGPVPQQASSRPVAVVSRSVEGVGDPDEIQHQVVALHRLNCSLGLLSSSLRLKKTLRPVRYLCEVTSYERPFEVDIGLKSNSRSTPVPLISTRLRR